MNKPQVVGAMVIANLIIRYLKHQLSVNELTELHNWVNLNQKNQSLFEQLGNGRATGEALQAIQSYSAGKALLKFLGKLNAG